MIQSLASVSVAKRGRTEASAQGRAHRERTGSSRGGLLFSSKEAREETHKPLVSRGSGPIYVYMEKHVQTLPLTVGKLSWLSSGDWNSSPGLWPHDPLPILNPKTFNIIARAATSPLETGRVLAENCLSVSLELAEWLPTIRASEESTSRYKEAFGTLPVS